MLSNISFDSGPLTASLASFVGFHTFPCQHCAFYWKAPVIPAQPARFTQRAVARYKPANRIAANGGANGASGAGTADGFGDLGVGGDVARRDG